MVVRALLLSAAVGLAALPAAAHAGTASILGTGGTAPRVVVDASGAAHVTWLQSEGGGRSSAYLCRFAVATPCAAPHRFPMPSDAAATQVGWTAALPMLLTPDAATVDVALPEFIGNRIFLARGPASGGPVGDPVLVHTDYRGQRTRSAVPLTQSSFALASWDPSQDVELFGAGPGTTTARARLSEADGAAGGARQSAIGSTPDAGMWFVYGEVTGTRTTLVGRHAPAAGTADAGAWTTHTVGEGALPSISSGPAGQFLASTGYASPASISVDQVHVRRLTGTTVGERVVLPSLGEVSDVGPLAITQAATSKRIAVAWSTTAAGYTGRVIAVASSDDAGQTWSAPIVVQAGISEHSELDIGLTPDGTRGTIVWSDLKQAYAADLTPVGPTTPVPPPATCTVPDLQTTTYAQAVDRITRAGCVLGPVRYVLAKRHPTDQVVAQSPPRGGTVPAGTKVAVSVALRQWARTIPADRCLPFRKAIVLQRFAPLAAAKLTNVTLRLNGRAYRVTAGARASLRLTLSRLPRGHRVRPGGKLVRDKLVMTLSNGQRFGLAARTWRVCGRRGSQHVPPVIGAGLKGL